MHTIKSLQEFKAVGKQLKELIVKSQQVKLTDVEYKLMTQLQEAEDNYCAGAEWALGL